MKNKQQIILGSLVLVIAISILVIVSFISQPQDVRSRAQTTDSTATPTPTAACQTPGGIQNVSIEYPNPTADNSGFIYNQANCSWSALTGAANYIISITEVETGTKVKNNETVSAGTTKVVFPVTNGKTYKCDVTAANACGTTGPVGTDTALCQTSFGITPVPTATPVVAPTATPVPAAPVATAIPAPPAQVIIPTSTPAPVIASPGNETPIVIGIAGVIITIIGGAIFFLAGL